MQLSKMHKLLLFHWTELWYINKALTPFEFFLTPVFLSFLLFWGGTRNRVIGGHVAATHYV